MKRLSLFTLLTFIFLPNVALSAANMENSFCITTYDGFKNLKDEFVFARTGETGNYDYYKKPPGNLYLDVPLETERISFLITKVDESGVEESTFTGTELSDFSEEEQLAIYSGKNNFSKDVIISQKDSKSKEFLTECHKLSLDARRGWLYPHNLLNNPPLLLVLIVFPLLFIFISVYLIKKGYFRK